MRYREKSTRSKDRESSILTKTGDNGLHFKKFIHVTTIVHLWSNYVGVLQKGVGDSGHRLKGLLLLDDVENSIIIRQL